MAETRARDLANIASTATGGIEGTEVKSTGESGGAKYLREDGDGTSSWQTVVQPTAGISNGNYLTANANVADNDFLRVDGTAVEGRTAAETLSDIGAAPLASPTFTGTTTVADFVPATPLSHRNMIINGAMNVHQRGGTISYDHAGTVTAYSLDRFKFYASSDIDEWDGTIVQHAMSSAEQNTTGFSNALKLTTGNAESDWATSESANIHQIIEAQNLQHLQYGTASAKSVTLSFWVKSSVTGTYAVGLYKEDSAGALNDRIINKTITISDTNWNKYTLTFPGDTDSSGAIANDNGAGIHVLWHLGAGSDNNDGANTSWETFGSGGWAGGHAQNGIMTTASATFYLTGVQFELGSVATPYEHRSYADELQRCRRYCYAFCKDVTNAFIGASYHYSDAILMLPVRHPVQMRTAPSATVTNSSNAFRHYRANDLDEFDTLAIDTAQKELTQLRVIDGTTSGTAGQAGSVYVATSGAEIILHAEL